MVIDGGLSALCAAWSEGVCGVAPPNSVVTLMPNLRTSAPAHRSAQGRAWTSLCSLSEFVHRPDLPEPLPFDEPPTAEPQHRSTDPPSINLSRAGYEQSVILLAACHEAMARGLSRVVWPIHIGDPGAGGRSDPDQPPPLDLIADACDRALLAAQLASVDAGRASMGVTIELPFVDFTDRQMFEVALDLGAPLAACWWCRREPAAGLAPTPCGACDSCSRWQRALTAASPGTSLINIVSRAATGSRSR